MALNNIKSIIDYYNSGNIWNSFFHKTSGTSVTQNRWFDSSLGSGTPKYNAYVGDQLAATVLTGSGNNGIYTGPSATEKYIMTVGLNINAASFTPSYNILCDYLLFYPLIDGSSLDLQELDNSTSLSRYTDGIGLQCVIINTTPMSTDGIITINYTDTNNTQQSTQTQLYTSATAGAILSRSSTTTATSGASPFIPLNNGVKGIKSIQSVQLSSTTDGFFTLILVKPLVALQMLETGVTSEKNMIQMNSVNPPKIYNDAYLNFITFTQGSAGSLAYRGYIDILYK